MDIKVKEEVRDVHEDYSELFFDCDIVKEETTIQEVNVPVQRIEAGEIATNEALGKFKITDVNSRDKAKKENKCNVCDKKFSRASYLKGHMLSHSDEGNFQCMICLKSFKHNLSLIKHIQTHTVNPSQCTICKAVLKNSSGLRDHTSRYHDSTNNSYECEKCGEEFSTKYYLKRHIKLIHESETFDCKICSRKYKMRYLLKNHMDIHHNPTKEAFPCNICNKTFRLKKLLQNHQKTHLTPGNEAIFKCIYCTKSCYNPNTFRNHMNTHHRGLPKVEGATPTCTICRKVFGNLENLKEHVDEIHPKNNVFECAICEFKTKYKHNMKGHVVKMHLKIPDMRNKKDTKCPVCSISMAKGSLKRHMTTHSVHHRPFACDNCGKKFKTKTHLKVHNVSHLSFDEKEEFKCVYCKDYFNYKNKLLNHTRSRHRGLPVNAKDPPFQCTVCQKTYEILDELKAHAMIH